MTTMTDFAGYLASAMVLLTFMTKDMRLLRVLAIFSNIAFVTYGMLVWLPPVFCLHLLLLPVNVLRLREMLTARSRQWTAEPSPLRFCLVSAPRAVPTKRPTRLGTRELPLLRL